MCTDVTRTYGILGTPAADSATGELYVSRHRQLSAGAGAAQRDSPPFGGYDMTAKEEHISARLPPVSTQG